MPKIITIAEYSRGSKTFPIGTGINVSWELAAELIEAGICDPVNKKAAKKNKKKSKKIIEDGSN
tara:strand:- start:97 stop:288 length:192 start_codon:yes stop_codon:yes gene_type:complete